MRACKCGAPLDYAAEGVSACWGCRDRVLSRAVAAAANGFADSLKASIDVCMVDGKGGFYHPNPWVLTQHHGGKDYYERRYNPPVGKVVPVYVSFTGQMGRCHFCTDDANTPRTLHLTSDSMPARPICTPCYLRRNHP